MATLKNWISRKPPAVHIGKEERVRAGTRKLYNFNLRRVLQLAITAQLVQLRLPPREASMHAFQFTDIASQNQSLHRRMGEVFHQDYTFLVIHGRQLATIANFKIDDTWRGMMFKSRGVPHLMPASIFLNVNTIDTYVRTVVALPVVSPPGVQDISKAFSR